MSPVHIGPYQLTNPLVLAPMAGVTDRPFRELCKRSGAGMVVAEMLTSDVRLWNSRKSSLRLLRADDTEPRSVQIAGGDPQMLTNAAQACVALGAQIVDINMGCPAKKVCNKAAGSALMQDETLVKQILQTVVAAVDVPVTLKIRTGWDHQHRNGVCIAKIAEDAGIAALAVHGRTRVDLYKGEAEYDTIAKIKQAVAIPVFANGDITSAKKAHEVLQYTGADGLLIGRGAQGKPWIFREIWHYLQSGELLSSPSLTEIENTVLEHLDALHDFYGDFMGIKIARKHIAWYVSSFPNAKTFRTHFNQLETAQEQRSLLGEHFSQLRQQGIGEAA